MADQFYENLWDEALKDLQEIFQNDQKFLQTPVFTERNKAYEAMQNNYVRYVEIIKKLGECYSEIIQPQERPVIKALLDSCVGRLLEIKKDLVEVEKTDFIYMDNILVRSKKTIADLEIVIPEYYRTERIEKLKDIDLIILEGAKMKEKRLAEAEEAARIAAETDIEMLVEGHESVEEDQIESADTSSVKNGVRRSIKRPQFEKTVELTEEELAVRAAISLLQRHERARVGRLQTQILKEKKRLIEDIAWLRHKPIPEDVKFKVFKKINRYWQRYRERRHQSYRAVSRNIVMGLLEPSWKPGNELQETIEELHENRRTAQKEAWEAMQDAAVAARIRLERNTDRICDDIADELRYYIYQWYKYMEQAGYPMLPVWPDPTPVMPTSSVFGIPKGAPQALVDKLIVNVVNTLSGKVLEPLGGSALITAGHWIPVEAYALIVEQMAKSKGGNKTKDKTKEKEKLKKEKLAEAKRIADLKKQGYVPNQSKFIQSLAGGMMDYRVDWEHRDIKRGHNQDMVDFEVAKNLHLELRAEVDEKMRAEIDRLQDAINRDRHIKPKKKKDKKAKKNKKGKKGGKKGKKDLTEGISVEELLTDLASHDMLTNYNKKFFIDLPGAPSLVNYERRNVFHQDPPPQWGDFKQVIKEYCVLSLGSNFVHERAPLVRSVLICGPQNLIESYADVICTESGAVKFILDPLKMPLKEYPRKMLEHLLNKVPRLIKPGIIFIPQAEKVFYKKVPKEEREFNPKAISKLLPKIVKAIKPGDQILVLGVSDQPWVSAANRMTKVFDKVICFPDCDYQSLNMFWNSELSKYHNADKYIDSPTLTTMTIGYGQKELHEKLDNIMTANRIINLKMKPLKISEICMDLPPLETGKKGKKGKNKPQNAWDWSQKSVKMYKQRQTQLILEATQREKGQKSKQPERREKEKKKEIPESFIVNNSLVSRALDRPIKSCGEWAPERQIDSVKDYYGLPKPTVNLKLNLSRNEKSLPQFTIRRPPI